MCALWRKLHLLAIIAYYLPECCWNVGKNIYMFAPFTVCSYMPSMCTLYPDISTLTQVGMHTAHMPASLLSELLVFTLLLIFLLYSQSVHICLVCLSYLLIITHVGMRTGHSMHTHASFTTFRACGVYAFPEIFAEKSQKK